MSVDPPKVEAGKVHIEVFEGKVVAVWVNCLNLPFQQFEVTAERATELGGVVNPDTIINHVDVTGPGSQGWGYM